MVVGGHVVLPVSTARRLVAVVAGAWGAAPGRRPRRPSVAASPPSGCSRITVQHLPLPAQPPPSRPGPAPARPPPHLQAFRAEHPGLLEALAGAAASMAPASASRLLRHLEAELPPALADVAPSGDCVLVALPPGLLPLLGEWASGAGWVGLGRERRGRAWRWAGSLAGLGGCSQYTCGAAQRSAGGQGRAGHRGGAADAIRSSSSLLLPPCYPALTCA